MAILNFSLKNKPLGGAQRHFEELPVYSYSHFLAMGGQKAYKRYF